MSAKDSFKHKASALALAVAISVSTAAPVHASGFPTVDLAQVAQGVADYNNQLLQYAEMMQQTVEQKAQTILDQSQLVQLVNQYEQMMTSYNHMLRQMTALKNMMDRRDWEGLYKKYASVIDSFPGSGMTDFSAGKWINKGKELQSLYARINKINDLEDAIRAIPFNSKSDEAVTEATEQSFARQQLAVGQSLFVEDMNDEIQTQMERYGEVAQKRASLGAEDHLATLQVMAEQNELMIEAAQQQNAINNAQLQYSNQLPAHIFAKQNKGRMASLSAAKDILSDSIEVDNSQLSNY